MDFFVNGKRILLDDQDADLIAAYSCSINHGYARLFMGKQKREFLHRVICKRMYGAFDGQVDHINGETLDNRRQNLRIASHAENQRNRGTQSNNSTGFKGVHWCKKKRKYLSKIQHQGKSLNLGYYDDAKDAAKAYNTAALKYFGEFAYLNKV